MNEDDIFDKFKCSGCLVINQCTVFFENRIICPCKICLVKMICSENTCKEYDNLMHEQLKDCEEI